MVKNKLTPKKPKGKIAEALEALKVGPGQGKVHVIANMGKWAVRKENSNRAHRVVEKKRDAVALAISVAEKISLSGQVSVVVHKKDGTVENRRRIN
jgi:hypothetical protein